MKAVSISGSLRANVGKKDAVALRNANQVPCVLYGGKEQIHFAVPSPEFKNLIYTPEVQTVDLSISGKKYSAILQEAQYHALTDNLIHVDFLEIIPGKPVIMNIPIKTTGTSPGVRAGGKLVKKLKTLKVKGAVDKMPDNISIAIDSLEIGQGILVSDIKLDGLTLLNAPNVTVVSVQVTRAAVANADEAAKAAAPAKGAAPAAAAKAPAAAAAKPAAAAAAKPAAKK